MSETLEQRLRNKATDDLLQVYASDVVEILNERDARIAELQELALSRLNQINDLYQQRVEKNRRIAELEGLAKKVIQAHQHDNTQYMDGVEGLEVKSGYDRDLAVIELAMAIGEEIKIP